jgi:HSP20 family protein
MLIRWSPYGDFANLFQSFDNLVRQAANPAEAAAVDSEETAVTPWLGRMSYPAVESFRRGDNHILRIEIPGVDPKDLEMTVVDGRLVLKGEKRRERKEEDKDHYLREVAYGRFERSFRLPRGIKGEQLQARHENGVLTVTIPAQGLEDASRRVPIQISSGTEEAQAKEVARSA